MSTAFIFDRLTKSLADLARDRGYDSQHAYSCVTDRLAFRFETADGFHALFCDFHSATSIDRESGRFVRHSPPAKLTPTNINAALKTIAFEYSQRPHEPEKRTIILLRTGESSGGNVVHEHLQKLNLPNLKIESWWIQNLMFTLPKHVEYVPHEPISASQLPKTVLTTQLPTIFTDDPVSRWFAWEPGTIIRITRYDDQIGPPRPDQPFSFYYRIVKSRI